MLAPRSDISLVFALVFAMLAGLACNPLREYPELAASDGSLVNRPDPSGTDAANPRMDASASSDTAAAVDVRGVDARPLDGPPRPAGTDAAPAAVDARRPPDAATRPASGTVALFPLGSGARDLALGPDGTLWFTQGSNKVGKVSPDGVVTQAVFSTRETDPYGIVVTPEGDLWLTGTYDDHVAHISAAGVVREFEVPTFDSGPDGIALGPDGNLWFTAAGNPSRTWISRLTRAGEFTDFDLPEEHEPNQITLGPDGNLWFTVYQGFVGRITPAGRITEFRVPGPEPGLMDIERGPDGNLWFTERHTNKIGRITPSGAITEFPLPDSGPDTEEAWLDGITAGKDGNLWFARSDPPMIGRVTPSGVITQFPLGDISPERIAADRDGNLWFTADTSVIGRFTP